MTTQISLSGIPSNDAHTIYSAREYSISPCKVSFLIDEQCFDAV